MHYSIAYSRFPTALVCPLSYTTPSHWLLLCATIRNSMRAHIVTYGCQMNEYDTHAIRSELAGIGYSFVDSYKEADLVLVNTCAARGKPVEKAQTLLRELRKEKRQRGNLTIGLIGC